MQLGLTGNYNFETGSMTNILEQLVLYHALIYNAVIITNC